MKKLFTFIFAIILNINVLAQTPVPHAVDFTATDIHGKEVHLFDILDGGQYVLIDFFFTTCGGCIDAVPFLVESYYDFGCNRHDVVYIEISDRNSDENCLAWTENHGVEYPTISGNAGGRDICRQYMISSFPTVVLIAPNHDIMIRDLYPINDAQSVITKLEEKGVEQHACDEGVDEIGSDAFAIYPNPANGFIRVVDKRHGESLQQNIEIYDITGRKVLISTESEINVSKLPQGIYFVKIGEKTQRFIISH